MQLQLQSSHDMLSKHVTEAELVLFFFTVLFSFLAFVKTVNNSCFAHPLTSYTQDLVHFFHPKFRMNLFTNLQLSLILIYHIQ